MPRLASRVALSLLALGLALVWMPSHADDAAAPEQPAVEQPAEQAASAAAYQTPVLITDVGQGNNGTLLRAMMQRAGFAPEDYKLEGLATADHLDGVKTLVIGVGASTKGLGAAGLNTQQERDRTIALIEAAKARNIPIVGVHMGGEARRGELSDEFNRLVYEHSNTFVLWQGGNADGFFTRLAAEHTDVKLVSIASRTGVGDELRKLIVAAPAAE